MASMKRCPQCLFIYPESDERCDFDNTPLTIVAESEIEAAMNPMIAAAGSLVSITSIARPNRKALPIAAAAGLALGVIMFLIYYGFTQQIRKAPSEAQSPNNVSAELPVAPSPPPASPSPSQMVSPSPSPSITPKTSSTRTPTAPAGSSSYPVSTSGTGTGTSEGHRPVILLISGGKLEVDEVWRTRDGVWYRQNGIVTLLKRGRVKAIE